jgi:hypothetical protein
LVDHAKQKAAEEKRLDAYWKFLRAPEKAASDAAKVTPTGTLTQSLAERTQAKLASARAKVAQLEAKLAWLQANPQVPADFDPNAQPVQANAQAAPAQPNPAA